MTQPNRRLTRNEELRTAIGLVWGHLNTRRFDDAYTLARGCIQLWPDDRNLRVLLSYASVEMGMWLDEDTKAFLNGLGDGECSNGLLKKSELHRNLLGDMHHD